MPNFIPLSEATRVLATAERLLVVGCSGGGKSTLSVKLSAKFNLDYLSIDRDVRWLPGWVVRDNELQRRIFQELVQQERWVMDGTSPSSFDIRLPRSDLVIWVRVPRRVALAGLARRVFKYFGKTRPEMADGCPEPIPDREFLSYIWFFDKREAPKVVSQLDKFGPQVPVVVLRSRREFDRLLA